MLSIFFFLLSLLDYDIKKTSNITNQSDFQERSVKIQVNTNSIAIKDEDYEGNCGPNATYSFHDGVLTISGSGDMDNYTNGTQPWQEHQFASLINKVIIKEGITSVGRYVFYNCTNLVSVTIPNTISIINEYSFYNCINITSITIPDGVLSIGNYCFYY